VPEVVLVLGASAGGIGRHVRTLAHGTGAVVLGPADTGLRFGFPRFVPVRPLRLRKALRRLSPDIVHAHGVSAGAFAVLAVRTLRPRPSIVVSIHNGAPDSLRARVAYRMLEFVVARGADTVLAVSEDLASRMRSLGARDVEMAVIAAPFTPSRGRATPGSFILAAGRLAPQKGFGTLLAAASSWADLSVRLLIAGAGPLEGELRRRAASLGVPAEFLGHRDDVDALLASAAVFVLPSRWEGQPLVLAEALRAGVPVVASDVGGIPALTGPAAAVLVPPGDAAALGDAVRSVLTDPDLAARLRAAALARSAELPTESDSVAAAQSVYARLRRPPRPNEEAHS